MTDDVLVFRDGEEVTEVLGISEDDDLENYQDDTAPLNIQRFVFDSGYLTKSKRLPIISCNRYASGDLPFLSFVKKENTLVVSLPDELFEYVVASQQFDTCVKPNIRPSLGLWTVVDGKLVVGVQHKGQTKIDYVIFPIQVEDGICRVTDLEKLKAIPKVPEFYYESVPDCPCVYAVCSRFTKNISVLSDSARSIKPPFIDDEQCLILHKCKDGSYLGDFWTFDGVRFPLVPQPKCEGFTVELGEEKLSFPLIRKEVEIPTDEGDDSFSIEILTFDPDTLDKQILLSIFETILSYFYPPIRLDWKVSLLKNLPPEYLDKLGQHLELMFNYDIDFDSNEGTIESLVERVLLSFEKDETVQVEPEVAPWYKPYIDY